MHYVLDLYRELRTFPRTVKLFYVSDIFFGFAIAIFHTLFNLHLLAVGYTADDVGLLQSISFLGMAVVAIPIGLAGDRWGRRGLYVAGSFLFGVPYLIMPWLTDFRWLVAAFTIGTVGNAMMFVNESPLLAGEVDSGRRASVFSFMMINFFIWNTLGIQLAGFLSEWLPAGALSKYQWPLVIAGISGIISGAIRAPLPWKKQPLAKGRISLRPSGTVLKLSVVALLAGAFTVLMMNFKNVILAERFGFGSEAISTFLTIAGVAGWVGSTFVPLVSRRMGELRGYALVVALQGGLLIGLGFAEIPSWFLGGMWVQTFIGNMQMALYQAFSMEVAPAEERATANSFAMVGRNLGSALASKGFGAAIAANNYIMPFAAAGLLALATAAAAIALFRRAQPVRTERGLLRAE